jgi:hypothetical protein
MAEVAQANTITPPAKTRLPPLGRVAYTIFGATVFICIVAFPFIKYDYLALFLYKATRTFFRSTNELIDKAIDFQVTKAHVLKGVEIAFTFILACTLAIMIPTLAYLYDSRDAIRAFLKDNPYVEKLLDAVDVPRFWFQLGWMGAVALLGIEAYVCIIYNWYDVSA